MSRNRARDVSRIQPHCWADSEFSRRLAPGRSCRCGGVSIPKFTLCCQCGRLLVIQFSPFSVKESLTSSRWSHPLPHLYDIHLCPRCAGLPGILPRLDASITKDNPEKFPLAGYPAEHWLDHARFEDISRHTNVGIEHPFNPNKSYLAAWVRVHDQPGCSNFHWNTLALCHSLWLPHYCKVPGHPALTGCVTSEL